MEDRNRQRRVYRWEDRLPDRKLSQKEVLNILSKLDARIEIKDMFFRNYKNCSTVEAQDDELGTSYTLYLQKNHRYLNIVLHEVAHILLDIEDKTINNHHNEKFVHKLIDLFDSHGVESKECLVESAKQCNII